MPRHRRQEREQELVVPLHFEHQIQTGSIEHAIGYLVDNEIDLSGFGVRYVDDEENVRGLMGRQQRLPQRPRGSTLS